MRPDEFKQGWLKPGPKPKSNEERLLDGSYRADRHGPTEGLVSLIPKPKPLPAVDCGGWQRYIVTKSDEASADAGCWCDERLGDHVIRFFEGNLCHSKGRWAGEKFTLADWQKDILRPLFGWVRPNGRRRFRRCYIEIPKKNGKSTLASGVGLYLLLADGEPGAEVYSVASDREQANIVHREAMNMVEASDELRQLLTVRRSHYNIYHRASRSYYRSISSQARTKEGLNAHGLVMDELHVWPDRELWESLLYAGRSRTEPLKFIITTAGDNMVSICREEHDYAQSILDGTYIDDRVFAFMTGAEIDVDFDDRKLWYECNPSMGVTMDEEEFAYDLREARKSPTAWATFLRYSFNVWNTGSNPWIRKEDWDACFEDFGEDELEGEYCWLGLDLAKTRDLTAATWVFPDGDGFRQVSHFWMPEDIAKDRKGQVPYADWVESGHLTLTEGNVCDYNVVRQEIDERSQRYRVQKIVYDPKFAEEVTQGLMDDLGIERKKFNQSLRDYAGPTAEYERLVLAKLLKHNGNPVLSWQAGNVHVKPGYNGELRPIKQKSDGDFRTIDGIVAGIMALSQATEEALYYDGPGVHV